MGNCVFKGFRSMQDEMVKIATSSGGIMELYAPISAECITNEFPGHAIFRSQDIFSPPLLHTEELQAGQLYYLLPLNTCKGRKAIMSQENDPNVPAEILPCSMPTPYRMSLDNQRATRRPEVFPRYSSTGVWKVKLVISPEQLSEILSQETRTEALIEDVRTLAKCGANSASSVASSDQLSISSSWKGTTENFGS